MYLPLGFRLHNIKNNLVEEGRKEGNVLFNDTLNTFLFTVIWHQTWLRTILIVRKKPAVAT